MILCVGPTPALQRTMRFDRVAVNDVNRAHTVRAYASGKATNVARVLQAIGETPVVTGFLGGEIAMTYRDDLDQSKIRHEFVDVPSPTRVCVTVIDDAAATATELVEESAPVDEGAWEKLLAVVSHHASASAAIVISGSLPPKSPPGVYGEIVRIAHRAGIPAMIDARGEEMSLAIAERPFVAKLNRAELGATVGTQLDRESDIRLAMSKLIDRGARWAVVTLGAEGALVSDGREFWRIESPPVKTISAVGSGDAFMAGLAAGILRGLSVSDACRMGAACGAANAMSPYAGDVALSDVVRL